MINVTKTKERFFSIPYIGAPSHIIKKHLERLGPNVRITFSSCNLNKRFFTQLKDKIPHKKCSELVYKVACKDCNSGYIGETMQLLGNRLAQHNNDVKFKRKSTALCEHSYETGHSFDFEGGGQNEEARRHPA